MNTVSAYASFGMSEEVPPKSKKSSCIPRGAHWNTCSQMRTSSLSKFVR